MTYIQQAFNIKHDFWRYLVGSVIVIIAATIGQIPFGIAVFAKAASDGENMTGLTTEKMMSILEPNLSLFLMLISFAVAMLALVLVVKFLHKQTIRSVGTSRKKLDWKRIWFAFFFWGILSSGLVLLDYYMAPEDYVYNFEWQRFAILAVIAIALIPIQTSFEEYLFRGYLMQGFGTATKNILFPIGFILSFLILPLYVLIDSSFDFHLDIGFGSFHPLIVSAIVVILIFAIFHVLKALKLFETSFYFKLQKSMQAKWMPLIITSVIFGMLHFWNPEVDKLGPTIMVYYIGTGLFLGIMTLMDEGLELALGFHAANNLFTALLVTADWTVFQTYSVLKDIAEPELGFIDLVLPVFILFPIVLFIFAKKYKWTNWKDKLFGPVHAPPTEDYKVIGENIDSTL